MDTSDHRNSPPPKNSASTPYNRLLQSRFLKPNEHYFTYVTAYKSTIDRLQINPYCISPSKYKYLREMDTDTGTPPAAVLTRTGVSMHPNASTFEVESINAISFAEFIRLARIINGVINVITKGSWEINTSDPSASYAFFSSSSFWILSTLLIVISYPNLAYTITGKYWWPHRNIQYPKEYSYSERNGNVCPINYVDEQFYHYCSRTSLQIFSLTTKLI